MPHVLTSVTDKFYAFDLGCTGPKDTDCKACRLIKDAKTDKCYDHCPEKNSFLTSDKVCHGES